MLFPILPFRTKKLTFPLCRSCAEKLEDFCSHDDNGRALYGTWTSVEIHRALTTMKTVKNIRFLC